MGNQVPRAAGKVLFGRIAQTYDRVRLGYPPEVYEILRSRCGLRPGCRVFEVGPGTGKATKQLLRYGADPLVAIEPNPQMVRFLRQSLGTRAARVRFIPAPIERWTPTPGTFDLGAAATSFHWVSQRAGLSKVTRALRPGGWWAAWGNRHGDPFRKNPFQTSIDPLYREILHRIDPLPAKFNLREERTNFVRALKATGKFDRITYEYLHWRVTLPGTRVRALWSTFSDILVLSPQRRTKFLDELSRTVEEEFSGRAEVRMLTPLCTARRI